MYVPTKFIKNHPLLSFFILVFGIMYIAGLIGITGLHTRFSIPIILLAIIGSFAPTIAAAIVLSVTEGKPGIRKLFNKFLVWKVGFGWYLATLSVTILSATVAISYLVYNSLPIPAIPILGSLWAILFGVILGPLSEEAGWSGYALPRLQSRYSAFTASLILGALWAVWHLPLWFIPGMFQGTMNFGLFFVALVAVRFIMGWAYNNTKGSLLIAVLFHLFFNFGNQLAAETLGVPVNAFLYLAATALAVCAVSVIIVTGPKNLSRKNERIKM